jgi:signal peptidase I
LTVPGLILVGLLLAVHAHFRLALVSGESMLPNLGTGDLLIVAKRAYANAEPARGDIVLARYENEFIVKRVVGLPGEELAVHYGGLEIDGAAVAEPYPIQRGALEITPGTLFHDRFGLLGDNRALGASRTVAIVLPKEQILGKVIGRLHLHALGGVDPADN